MIGRASDSKSVRILNSGMVGFCPREVGEVCLLFFTCPFPPPDSVKCFYSDKMHLPGHLPL